MQFEVAGWALTAASASEHPLEQVLTGPAGGDLAAEYGPIAGLLAQLRRPATRAELADERPIARRLAREIRVSGSSTSPSGWR